MSANNKFFSLQKGFLALMSAALLFSCSQIDNFETSDLRESDETLAAKSKMNAAANVVYFTYSDDFLCLGEEVTVTFNINQEVSCGTARIDMKAPGDIDWLAKVSEGTPANGLLTYTFTPAMEGSYQFRGTYSEENDRGTKCGSNINGFVQDNSLLVEICDDCEDEFTAETTCDGDMRSATFTFKAAEAGTYKIQGGLTAGSYDVQVIGAEVIRVTNLNNNIISKDINLESCGTHTITVTWKSTNSDESIIGDWSVEKDKVEILVLEALSCNSSGEGVAPSTEL